MFQDALSATGEDAKSPKTKPLKTDIVVSGTQGTIQRQARPPGISDEKLSSVLSKRAGPKGKEGIKPIKNGTYKYELKFLGEHGDVRLFGNLNELGFVVFTKLGDHKTLGRM